MTQIKGTFEGCGEAPAPLKLNEVFISHADGTLNTARSRAVTVNVPLRAFAACLASPPCLKETKGWSFHAIFHASPSPRSPFLTPGFLRLLLLSPVFAPSATAAHQLLTTKLPFLSLEQEKICIVVSPWIWKPRGRVNVREVWQQQSVPMEGGTKTSETWDVSVEREPTIGRLSDERQKAAFKALIARHSESPLKVSFPSNYIFHFISALRQTASESLEGEKKTLRSSVSLSFFI